MVKHFTLGDGTVMCYEEKGSGRPIIFLHGWGGNKQPLTQAYSDAVADAGYRFICFDLRGSKDTEPTKTHPVTMAQLVDDIHEFIVENELDDITIVGHSMGTMDTMDYVRRYGCDHVRSFFLMDAAPKSTTAEGYGYATLGNTYKKETGYEEVEWMKRDIIDYFSNWVRGTTPDMPEDEAKQWAEDYVAQGYPDETVELYADCLEFDGRDALDKYTVPVEYVHPAEGTLVMPEVAEYYRTAMSNCPDYTAVGIEGASDHFFCIDEEYIPQITQLMLEFFKKGDHVENAGPSEQAA